MRRVGHLVRRVAPIGIVLVLVVGAGVTALQAAASATAKQEAVHRSDRVALSEALATLTKGYLGQLAATEQGAAAALASVPPAELPRALAVAVDQLRAATAAVLVSDSGGLVAGSAGAAGLGGDFRMIEAETRPMLASGQPGITPVLDVGGVPTVVVVVPAGGSALLGVAYRLDGLSIASYVRRLTIGRGGVSDVVDRNGVVFSSPDAGSVGRPGAAAVRAALAGAARPTITQTLGSDQLVAAAAPVGFAGYELVVTQPAPEFYGALWHGDTTARWALLALLVVAAAALLVMHARRQAALAAVADMAVKDALTGLPNRMAFSDALDDAMSRHRRDGIDVALLFCDLDGFKQVNDRLGHGVGDRLLVAVADRLREAVDAQVDGHAVLARLGGDEFTVLLEAPHATPHAQHLAGRLADALAQPFVIGSDEVRIGVSVGIAYAHPDRDLLVEADLSMYRTKAMRRAVREAEASGTSGAREAREAWGGIATFPGPGFQAAGG